MRRLLQNGPRPIVSALVLAVTAATLGCSPAPSPCPPEATPASGPWHAELASPGGPLPFGLELRPQRPDAVCGELVATIRNGDEAIPVERVSVADGRVTLSIDRYDSRLEAALHDGGRRLEGRWTKTAANGAVSELPFVAVAGDRPRFAPAPRRSSSRATVSGRWSVRFDGDDEPAIGIFDGDDDGRVTGTFLTTTGDYRYLEGDFDGRVLRLSCFDGAHAFLFRAELAGDDTLRGDFWSRDSWHQTWTARRDPDAKLPDAFSLTTALDDRGLDELVFRDLDGREVALDDPSFEGRARIVELFGSWCPNCNDAIADLVELDRRYRDRGLSIVGVAFELGGDRERDARQVRRFAEYHDVGFPLLVGGISDKAAASTAFPLVDRVRSYPTTIFFHGDGRVRAVHQGYTGPATGDAHRLLRERFEAIVRELLDEGAG